MWPDTVGTLFNGLVACYISRCSSGQFVFNAVGHLHATLYEIAKYARGTIQNGKVISLVNPEPPQQGCHDEVGRGTALRQHHVASRMASFEGNPPVCRRKVQLSRSVQSPGDSDEEVAGLHMDVELPTTLLPRTALK